MEQQTQDAAGTPEGQALPPYWCFVVKGWTKTKLAERLGERLAPIDPDSIVSIAYAVDLPFFAPWRRNSALVVARPVAWEDD